MIKLKIGDVLTSVSGCKWTVSKLPLKYDTGTEETSWSFYATGISAFGDKIEYVFVHSTARDGNIAKCPGWPQFNLLLRPKTLDDLVEL